MEKFDMYAQLYESNKRFDKACQQIQCLTAKLDGIKKRYNRAKEENHKTFRYSLRMRIMVLEGLLRTYCHYTCLKKNEVLDLRFKLYGENPDDGENYYNMDSETDEAGNDGE